MIGASYFTESFFRDINNNVSYSQRREHENRTFANQYESFDIFLSYNIADIDVVKGIYYFLTSLKFKVYLDCIVDPQLKREDCDKDTAELIHNRIVCSKSLIYASSFYSSQSKWMPWELGVADGHHNKCFVLPVSKEYESDFKQKEYLQLYPLVVKDNYGRLKLRNSYGNFMAFKIS